MKPQTALITGASGYLGLKVLENFLSHGIKTYAVVRPSSDITVIKKLDEIYMGQLLGIGKLDSCTQPIDTVVHCATDYGRKGHSDELVWEANFNFGKTALAWAEKNAVKRFINAGTTLDPKTNVYAQSKQAFVEHMQSREKLAPQKFNLALEHFYGPGDTSTKFMTWLIRELLSGSQNIPLTRGDQIRNFIYIDDVVLAFRAAVELKTVAPFSQWHVASGENAKLKKIVEQVCELCDRQRDVLKFGEIQNRENERLESVNNLPAFTSEGWAPRVPLKEGLAKTVEFEKANLQNGPRP